MVALIVASEVVSLGFDAPENVERYRAVVDSLTANMPWGIVVVGEGDTVLLGDSLLGVAPLSFKPDTFPVLINVVGKYGSRTFSVDADTETVVVIYASPPEEEKREVKLPPHEEVRDGYAFNLHGKRVVVVKSRRKGWQKIVTYTDTSTLKYYWPQIDSLVGAVDGKGIVLIGASDVVLDGVRYPRGVRVINRVPPGVHKLVARGPFGVVRSYLTLDSVDVAVFLLSPSDERVLSLLRSTSFTPRVERTTAMLVGGTVGGTVGCCVGLPFGLQYVGCLLGTVLGGVLGQILWSSCM